MSTIVEYVNSNAKMILKKSNENIKTNLALIERLKDSDIILCPQSSLELAQIYWEHKIGLEEILKYSDNINIPQDDLKEIIFSFMFICENLEEIAELDDKNGGNLKMCIDAIKNNTPLDFSDFTEKADMIHLNCCEHDEDVSFKSKLRQVFSKVS